MIDLLRICTYYATLGYSFFLILIYAMLRNCIMCYSYSISYFHPAPIIWPLLDFMHSLAKLETFHGKLTFIT